MKSNKPTKAQYARFARLCESGCVICGKPAEIHHCKIVAGCRKDHDKVIPLCDLCHRNGGYGVAIHAGKAQWELLHGSEDYWLFMVATI